MFYLRQTCTQKCSKGTYLKVASAHTAAFKLRELSNILALSQQTGIIGSIVIGCKQ